MDLHCLWLETLTEVALQTSPHWAILRRARPAGAPIPPCPTQTASLDVCVMAHAAFAIFPDDGGKSDSAKRSRKRKHPAPHALTMN